MKKLTTLFLILASSFIAKSQIAYDSLTISKFLLSGEEMYGANWRDTLKAGHYPNYISNESKVWDKANRTIKTPQIITLLSKIKGNGTEDVSKCFIPRHAVNYYKGGKLVKYLLICFECDGVRFSDDPPKTFIKNAILRETQMIELKGIFKDLL